MSGTLDVMRQKDWRVRGARETPIVRAFRQRLKDEYHECWVNDKDGKCHARGVIADHYPPLSEFADPRMWQGVLLPMCRMHSNRQSGLCRQGKAYAPPPTRQW